MDSKKPIDFDKQTMEIVKLIGQVKRDIDVFFYSSIGLLICTVILTIIVLLE